METHVKRLRIPAISLLLAALVLIPSLVTLDAGDPHGAYYSTDTDKVFWFIHASDLHVGTSGSTDTSNLQWLVTTAREVIAPSFMVVTGDLTDSTNGNIFGYPTGPYQAEWDQYKSILTAANAGPDFFYDLPGNHDAYNDKYFAYYLANSVQGRATGKTQVSWTKVFPFGTYHFLGVNSADNTGAPFSLFWPYGDYAGLDEDELAFISSQLAANTGATLTMVFGHHPVTSTGNSQDTFLFYGHQEFVGSLDNYAASEYGYGHTHANGEIQFTGNSYTGTMLGGGIRYSNVASLGKDSPASFSVVAVDCDGVSSVTRPVGTWPVVLITAPVDRYVGATVNPYAYTVPAASSNVVRALVFDTLPSPQVSYRIDGGTTWYSMSRAADGSPVYQGAWNASALTSGDHTIEVRAVGTTTVSDAITVEVTSALPTDLPPTAMGDSYTTNYETTLTVAAPGVLANDSDPEGRALTAALVEGPDHGTLTLNTNGSFTYTPATSYNGPDSFTYTASDGTLVSAPVMVSITVAPAPVTDKVSIVSATYNARKKQLSVTATSSVQPNATLTVVGYGTMAYKTKTKTYVFTATVTSKPATVTVSSSRGGSATAAVT